MFKYEKSSVEQQHQVSKILGPPENRETTGKTSNAEVMENDLELILTADLEFEVSDDVLSNMPLPDYKYLTTVLKLLTNESRHKLQSTEKFIDAIKTVQIPDDYELVSFDVKSLFTSIPLQLALDCTATAIKNSTTKLPLPTGELR